MLQSLKIENFKRFKDLSLPNLKRVNLITGKNNTGKTGVLEALFLLLSPSQAHLLPNIFRNCGNLGNIDENYWKWIFYNHDTNNPAKISTLTQRAGIYEITITPNQNLPANYHFRAGSLNLFVRYLGPVSPGFQMTQELPFGTVPLPLRLTEPQKDALDYDRVVLKAGGEERLEALLRQIEPRLKSIRSIKPHGAPLLYVDVGLNEKIPAVHLGQGFIRLLSIYSEIIASGKKILLIDEFENGLHYSVLTDVWRGVINATEKEGVQVFATTHSYECIRAAHAAFSETISYDFALHRLEQVQDEVVVTTYDKQTLETSLSSNFEIR